jgi:hypothetical protein
LLAAMQANFDPQEVWARVQWVEPEAKAAMKEKAV